MTDTRIGFIITFYKSTEDSEKILSNLLDVMKKQDEYYIVLATHSTVSEDIQSKCDYVIYEKFNYSISDKPYSWGIAELSLINKAFSHLYEMGIATSFKVSYDIEVVKPSHFKTWIIPDEEYVSCQWGEVPLCSHSFFATTRFMILHYPTFKTYNDMLEFGSTLEEAIMNYLKRYDTIYLTHNYGSQKEFYGPNKIDIVGYDMNNIDFWYTIEDYKFHIRNRTGRDIKGPLRIYDYYTDIAMESHKEFSIPDTMEFWMTVPIQECSARAQNGWYLLFTNEDGFTIRKNFGIKDMYKKHPLAKRLGSIDYTEPKFNEFTDFEDYRMYNELNINLNDIKTYIDLGANWGFSMLPFLERGCSITLVDPDETNINILNKTYGDLDNVTILPYAIYREDGEISFYLDNVASVVSSVKKIYGLNEDRREVRVKSMHPDTLLKRFDHVDFMKIDIEAAEYDLFEVVSKEQIQKVDRILIEFHENYNKEIIGLIKNLAKLGFNYKYCDWGLYHDPIKINNQMGIIYATRKS